TTPGVYPIRVETPSGISNLVLFTVGTFPEFSEEESQRYSPPNRNDSIETAQPLSSSPLTVNGTLRGAERDIFRVEGKAGERRVFEVEARRCGSAVDPVLRILDSAGKQLARSEDTPATGLDARLEFTFPKEGNYYVEVHDARFSEQEQNFYRLKMGAYPYADAIFPLGGRRGETVDVTFSGARLQNPVKASADLGSAGPDAGFTSVALPGSPALPFLFAISDLAETAEPVNGSGVVPGIINGRLAEPGEIDRYRFNVKPGDDLLFELEARELGTSRLEGVITVYGPDGKKLDSAGDKPLAEDVFAVQGTSRTSSDPFLNFKVPDGIDQIDVAVEDLARRGGLVYGYRLIARSQAEDFMLTTRSPYVNIPAGGTVMVDVAVDRRGYNGPIQLTIPDLPQGLKVEGGYIPKEYVDPKNTRTMNRRGVLTITADAGVEAPVRELIVWGEGTLSDGSTLRRRARGPGLMVEVDGATAQGVVDRQRPVTAPWLGFDLPMAISDPPPATLEVKQVAMKQLEEGGRYEFEYKWNVRARDLELPSKVTVDIIGARDIRITDMKQAAAKDAGQEGSVIGTFIVNTTKATDPARYDMFISAKLKGGEPEQEIVSRPIVFEVIEGSKGSDVASSKNVASSK
ncbi:MAG: PPC domain-containing protein, partial [Bryobacteraceae bacterium]